MNVVIIGAGFGSTSQLLARITANSFADSFISVEGNVNIQAAFMSGVQSDDLSEAAIIQLKETIKAEDLKRWAKTWHKHYTSMLSRQMLFDMNPTAETRATFHRYARDFHEAVQLDIVAGFEELGVDVVEYFHLINKQEKLEQQIDDLLAKGPANREEEEHRLFCEAFFGGDEYSEKHSKLIRTLRHNLPNAVLSFV